MKYYFYTLIVLLFLSCEEPVAVQELIDETQLPETTIAVDAMFTSSSITLNWDGNEYAISYRYRLEPLSYLDIVTTYTEWTEWDTSNLVNFENLDEGLYDFYIQSRFTSDVEEAIQKISFEVDAIEGPALRTYPLYQQVGPGDNVDVYIYVEAGVSIAGIELHLSYDPSFLTFGSVTPGDILSESPIFLEQENSSNGTLTVSTVAEDFLSYSGTGALAQISFTVLGGVSGSTTITTLETSVLIDPDNNYIELPENIHGIIEVVQ